MVCFMVDMVQMGFLKMTEDEPAIKNDTIIKVWWVNTMRHNNINSCLGIRFDQQFFDV